MDAINEAKMNEVNDQLQALWDVFARPEMSDRAYGAFCDARRGLLAAQDIELNDYFEWCSAKEGL